MSESSINSRAPLEKGTPEDEGVISWALENVLKPTANAALIEPYNAVANVVRVIPHAKTFDIRPADFLSTSWYAQNLSSGLAMVVPYGIAGKATGSFLRRGGEALRMTGAGAQFMQSGITAQVLGAAAYDGARDMHPGETRVGNAAGGAAAFFVFEKGNAWSKGLAQVSDRIVARSMTGMFGAASQKITADLISTGHMPSAEVYTQTVVTGAIMNVTLPLAQRGIASAVDHVNVKLGRGVPIDQVMQSPIGSDVTPTLAELVQRNPWARVQPAETGTANYSRNRITVADMTPEQLGHELSHLSFARSAEVQRGFAEARAKLQVQDETGAWQSFRETRLSQEIHSRQVENQIAVERGHGIAALSSDLASSIPQREVFAGKTYEQLWMDDFQAFRESGGTKLPELDYGGRDHRDSSTWYQRLSDWSELPTAKQADALRFLQLAPESTRTKFWYKAAHDEDPGIRLLAAQGLSKLPGRQRFAAWLDLCKHPETDVRHLAIERIADLPAENRLSAIKHVLANHQAIFGKDSYVREPWYYQRHHKSPHGAVKLVESVSSLPAGKQLDAWETLYRNPWSSEAAASNLEAIPERSRSAAWSQVYNSKNPGSVDALFLGVSKLPSSDRLEAWRLVLDRSHEQVKTGTQENIAKAFESLPLEPHERVAVWHQLLVPERAPSQHYMLANTRSQQSKGLDVNALEAIAALPENARLAAWNEVYRRTGSESFALPSLASAIRLLPQSERLGPWRQMLGPEVPSSVESSFGYAVIAPEHLPELTRFMLQLPAGPSRAKLLENFPLENIDDASLEVRIAASESVLRTAFEFAQPEDYGQLRQWWNRLPDEYVEGLPDNQQPTPVRDHLSQTLPANSLVRLMFAPEHQETAQRLAQEAPQVVRGMINRLQYLGDGYKSVELAAVAEVWLDSGSLRATAQKAVEVAQPKTEKWESPSLAPALVAELARTAPPADVAKAILSLRDLALGETTTDAAALARTSIALETAAQLGKLNSPVFVESFLRPLEAALADNNRSYTWRLKTARELSAVARAGHLGDHTVEFPDLRMPSPIDLTPQQQRGYRSQIETALFDDAGMRSMLGGGALGELFPGIFGHHESGGIVERPQHGGHAFHVDEHTMRVMQEVRDNRMFQNLSEKDQVNLLWATLMHDVGKQPGRPDPDHEWASANMTWGVLRGLGYPPQRIQRIADLISRHTELSYLPGRTSERFADDAVAFDIATHYRHPAALDQLLILNESDIRSINEASSYWRPEVAAELVANVEQIAPRVRRLNQNAIPLLTSELPQRFGFVPMSKDFAVLGHVSPHLDKAFLEQLALIESPEFSISASLLTPQHKALHAPGQPLLALVAGPAEHISQAHRNNLGTGTAVDWRQHVDLAQRWMTASPAVSFVAELNGKFIGLRENGQRAVTLPNLWQRLSKYDTLDELRRDAGAESLEWRAHQQVVNSLTKLANGDRMTSHNEVKLNNPTVVGIGVIRDRAPVTFQGMPPEVVARLFEGQPIPPWVILDGPLPEKTVVVSRPVWVEAIRRNLPIVVLDP